jgi:hypothetical protein
VRSALRAFSCSLAIGDRKSNIRFIKDPGEWHRPVLVPLSMLSLFLRGSGVLEESLMIFHLFLKGIVMSKNNVSPDTERELPARAASLSCGRLPYEGWEEYKDRLLNLYFFEDAFNIIVGMRLFFFDHWNERDVLPLSEKAESLHAK